MGDHLEDVHKIFEDENKAISHTTIESCTRPAINPKVLWQLIVEWIVDRRHAFNEVEAESFRNIIRYLDKTAVNFIPKSGNTVRADATKLFGSTALMLSPVGLLLQIMDHKR